MDNLKPKLSDQMLSSLLRWEYLYNGYLQMSVKYAEPEIMQFEQLWTSSRKFLNALR